EIYIQSFYCLSHSQNATYLFVAARNATVSTTNLKDVLADLIPKEQTRIKNFKQQYGKTNIGQITVDMVSNNPLHVVLNKYGCR
uniref:Uncharacterized protein n=1 Tax=Xiphophorus couchianus TaxID=32473 RepID=A0A3B5MHZ0_9TELE